MTSIEKSYTDTVEAVAIAAYWLLKGPTAERHERLCRALANWTEEYGLQEGMSRDQEPNVKLHYMAERRQSLVKARDSLIQIATQLKQPRIVMELEETI